MSSVVSLGIGVHTFTGKAQSPVLCTFFRQKLTTALLESAGENVACQCWSCTTQSTLFKSCRASQLTYSFLDRLGPLSGLPVLVHNLLPEIDNQNQQKGENDGIDNRKYFLFNLHRNVSGPGRYGTGILLITSQINISLSDPCRLSGHLCTSSGYFLT